jgi:hypothetical protein
LPLFSFVPFIVYLSPYILSSLAASTGSPSIDKKTVLKVAF